MKYNWGVFCYRQVSRMTNSGYSFTWNTQKVQCRCILLMTAPVSCTGLSHAKQNIFNGDIHQRHTETIAITAATKDSI